MNARPLRQRLVSEFPDLGDCTLRLTVDDIVSRADAFDYHVQPMICLREDTHDEHGSAGPSEGFRQRWDDPPDDDELDLWVKHGAGFVFG